MWSKLSFFLCLIALTLTPSIASSNPIYRVLNCDADSFFPSGISATFASYSDLKTMKSWCEQAGTSTLSIAMHRTDDSFVFEAAGYGSTSDVPTVRPKALRARLPWSLFSKPQSQLAARPKPGAQLNVLVDVSSQSMRVTVDGKEAFLWPVSTARRGKYTPRGSYGVQWLSKDHRSSLYNGAPMPFAIFFDGNFAIHGTDAVQYIGTPASAGCVRLLPEDAARLFDTVKIVGSDNVNIKIVD